MNSNRSRQPAPNDSSMRIPPISSASRSPPNSWPFTCTPIDEMPTIGNSPAISLPMSIWMPWIEPEKVTPLKPLIPVTLADSARGELGFGSSGVA